MAKVPTALVVALTLILGFAVAQATGIRPLGGIVLLAGLLFCVARWRSDRSLLVAIVLTICFAAAFVLSHKISDQVGAWPSVFSVSFLMALLSYGLSGRLNPLQLFQTPSFCCFARAAARSTR